MNGSLEVLVVGAGPTGLTMAAELARHGIGCRLVDRADRPTTLSKAIAVHARTLEILESMGLSEEMLAEGVKLRGAQVMSGGKKLVDASFDELETRYPFVLSIPQDRTEAVLARHVERLGVSVERSSELVSLSHDAGGVTVTLRRHDVEEAARFAWVIGCDGAHSRVRKAIGETFEGNQYDDRFLLADVRGSWDLPRDKVTSFFSETGLLAVFPLPGDRFRLIATEPPGQDHEDGWSPSLDEFQTIARDTSRLDVTLSDAAWIASFRIHCRQVRAYRHGRVFLAGDAAHIHSPAGGQGMNTGMQDAHNLAWKLALELRGEATPRVLDSYGTERHAVGVSLLRGTDFATRVATLRSPVARAVRDRVASFASQLEVVQQRMGKSVAELDLSYQRSPLVAENRTAFTAVRVGRDDDAETANVTAWRQFAAAPPAGARAPDGTVTERGHTSPRRLYELMDTRRHSLLLFDGRAPTEAGYVNLARIAHRVRAELRGRVDVHVVVPRAVSPEALAWDGSLLLDADGDLEHRYGAGAECLYVIRPDLYVGFRSQPADEASLFAWLSTVFAARG